MLNARKLTKKAMPQTTEVVYENGFDWKTKSRGVALRFVPLHASKEKQY